MTADQPTPVTTGPDGPPVAIAEAKAVKPLLVGCIEEAARSRLVAVAGDTLLAKVAALLSSTHITLVVVCNEAGEMVGVITETLLVRQLGYGQASVFTTRADEVMARDFTTCRPGDSLPELLAMMHRQGLAHVPVVDDGNHPVGVVLARDGLRMLLAEGHYEESLLRSYVMGLGYQ